MLHIIRVRRTYPIWGERLDYWLSDLLLIKWWRYVTDKNRMSRFYATKNWKLQCRLYVEDRYQIGYICIYEIMYAFNKCYIFISDNLSFRLFYVCSVPTVSDNLDSAVKPFTHLQTMWSVWKFYKCRMFFDWFIILKYQGAHLSGIPGNLGIILDFSGWEKYGKCTGIFKSSGIFLDTTECLFVNKISMKS